MQTIEELKVQGNAVEARPMRATVSCGLVRLLNAEAMHLCCSESRSTAPGEEFDSGIANRGWNIISVGSNVNGEHLL